MIQAAQTTIRRPDGHSDCQWKFGGGELADFLVILHSLSSKTRDQNCRIGISMTFACSCHPALSSDCFDVLRTCIIKPWPKTFKTEKMGTQRRTLPICPSKHGTKMYKNLRSPSNLMALKSHSIAWTSNSWLRSKASAAFRGSSCGVSLAKTKPALQEPKLATRHFLLFEFDFDMFAIFSQFDSEKNTSNPNISNLLTSMLWGGRKTWALIFLLTCEEKGRRFATRCK